MNPLQKPLENPLQKPLEAYRDTLATLASAPPEDRRFWPGYEMRVNQAKANQESHCEALGAAVGSVAGFVVLKGKNASGVASEATKVVQSAVVDLEGLYGNLVRDLRLVTNGNEFGVNQYSMLMRSIAAMGRAGLLREMVTTSFRPDTFANEEEFRAIVARYVNETVGQTLAVNYIKKEIANAAVRVLDSPVSLFPVFLLNAAYDSQPLLAELRQLRYKVSLSFDTDKYDGDTEKAVDALLNELKVALNDKTSNKTNKKQKDK